MLRQKSRHAFALIVDIVGALPVDQNFRIGQQFGDFHADDPWMGGVIARQHQRRRLAAAHEVAADIEDELAAPHVLDETFQCGCVKWGPGGGRRASGPLSWEPNKNLN